MRLFPASLILLLAWGALAVGGSPLWAGAPVAVLACTTGILGFLERRRSPASESRTHRRFTTTVVCLVLCVGAIAVQLSPLPAAIVERLSPAHDVAQFERLLAAADRRDPDLVAIVADHAPRPLSIAPGRTRLGLGFAFSFSLLFVGAVLGLSYRRLRTISFAITALGVIVAMLGIYQATSGTRVLYGLYYPMKFQSDPPTGPFINQNHQAGWLVMALSLTLGSFAGEIAGAMRGVTPLWRDRIIWFSSKEANLAIMQLFAALVMAIGILTTRSRSGAAALIAALTLLGFWIARRQPAKGRRWAVIAALLAVTVIAVVTSGSGVISRLGGDGSTFGGRLGAWRDTLRIINDFPLAGTGFNTYGVAMLHYQSSETGTRFVEAHNDYLQLAAEGGLLVGVPVLLLLVSLALGIARSFRADDDTRTYWRRAGAVVGIIAIAVQSLTDFTLQMPGGSVMFVTLLAIAIHHPWRRTGDVRIA